MENNQVTLVIKFGPGEVATSEFLPPSWQLRSWPEVCDMCPQCETSATK